MKTNKKLFAFALVAFMTASCFSGCGGSTASSNDNSKTDADNNKVTVKTMHDGKITFGAEMSYPPFESIADDGKTPIGFDIDLGKEIGDRLGLEVEFINTAFDGILEGIDVNYDCVLSAVTITDERKESCLFTQAYIDNYQSVVVPKGSTLKITSLNDLDGKSVALQKMTTSDEVIEDLTGKGTISCTKVAQEKVTTCFTQLSNGDVDVVLCDSMVADGYVLSEPDKYEIAFQDKTAPEQFGIAISKENTQLQKAIDDVITELKEDGTLDDIYEKWFATNPTE